MDNKLRAYLAELIGTFILVLVGAGTVCASGLTSPPLSELAPALAEGFTLAVLLTVTFHVSTGCLNPAITIMLWVFKRLDNVQAGWLIFMQLLGATLAGLVLRLMFRPDVLIEMHLGAPYLKAFNPENASLEASQLVSGTAFELLLGLLVALAAFATLFDRRAAAGWADRRSRSGRRRVVRLSFHRRLGQPRPLVRPGPVGSDRAGRGAAALAGRVRYLHRRSRPRRRSWLPSCT